MEKLESGFYCESLMGSKLGRLLTLNPSSNSVHNLFISFKFGDYKNTKMNTSTNEKKTTDLKQTKSNIKYRNKRNKTADFT